LRVGVGVIDAGCSLASLQVTSQSGGALSDAASPSIYDALSIVQSTSECPKRGFLSALLCLVCLFRLAHRVLLALHIDTISPGAHIHIASCSN
jgi:hypothetical protein